MKISQTIQRPANWQDFERLCKVLWGEIWNCAEIQMHGRSGQAQNGVDIFGMPKGEDGYFGIQCKGRNEYSAHRITEAEIEEEVDAAKGFDPPLKKLLVATTAQNDVKIQAHVRRMNLRHMNEGLFEVHVLGWESIVDLITENRKTHEYYVKSAHFRLESELPCLKVIQNKYWMDEYHIEIENSGSDLFGFDFGRLSNQRIFQVRMLGEPKDIATGGRIKMNYKTVEKTSRIVEDDLTFTYSDRHHGRYSQDLTLRNREVNVLFGPRYEVGGTE